MKHSKLAGSLFALVTMLLATGPASAAAKVFYVAANGADTAGCGTSTHPCRTIAYPLAGAAAGDRMIVSPGIYDRFDLNVAVSLESTHGAGATVIQGGGNTIYVGAAAAGAVIGKPSKGFTVRGGEVGIVADTSDVVVRDSIVTGSIGGVVSTGLGPRLTLTSSLVSAPQTVTLGGADATVTQNSIVSSGPGTGIAVIAPGSVISDNVVTGANLGAFVLAGPTTLKHNTFAANGNGVHVSQDAGGLTTVTSNNFLGSTSGPFGFNCGLSTDVGGQNAANNYWGSALGPGVDPADQVCGTAIVTTPFLKAPAFVNATGGR